MVGFLHLQLGHAEPTFPSTILRDFPGIVQLRDRNPSLARPPNTPKRAVPSRNLRFDAPNRGAASVHFYRSGTGKQGKDSRCTAVFKGFRSGLTTSQEKRGRKTKQGSETGHALYNVFHVPCRVPLELAPGTVPQPWERRDLCT